MKYSILILIILINHLTASSQITPVAQLPYYGNKEKQDTVKKVIPRNEVPYIPNKGQTTDSLDKRLAKLEEQLLALEAKTPYYAMDIVEITVGVDVQRITPAVKSLSNGGNVAPANDGIQGVVVLNSDIQTGSMTGVLQNSNPPKQFTQPQMVDLESKPNPVTIIKVDNPLTNNNPYAVIFVNFLNPSALNEEKTYHTYFANGSWYISVSSMIIQAMPFKFWPAPKILAVPNVYVLSLLKGEPDYQTTRGGPALVKYRELEKGEKIQLLIFAKKPSFKQAVMSIPVIKQQPPLLQAH